MVNLGCGAERMPAILVSIICLRVIWMQLTSEASKCCEERCGANKLFKRLFSSGEDGTGAQCKLCGDKERNLLSKVDDKSG